MLQARKQAVKVLVTQQKEILKSLYGTTGYAPEWEAFILDLPKRKLSKPSQRAQFVQFLYRYLSEYSLKHGIPLLHNRLDDQKVVKLAVLAELIICCQYYENYIFDGKNGVTTPELIRKYLNAAANLKSFIFQYVREHFSDELDTAERVRTCVDTIFNLTNVGQQMEVDYNHYDTFKRGLTQVPDMGPGVEKHIDYESLKTIKKILLKDFFVDHAKNIFFEVYLKRLNLISAQLFLQFTRLLIDLMGLEFGNCNPVTKFANSFGYFVQLINDNIDIAELHTGSKIPQDAFSDIRNKNITLPVFYHLTLTERNKISFNSIVRKLMESDHTDGLLFESKLVQIEGRYYKQTKPEIKTKIKESLIAIIKNYTAPGILKVSEITISNLDIELEAGRLLADMLTIGDRNRFYCEMGIDKIKDCKERKPSVFVNFYSNLLNKWIALPVERNKSKSDRKVSSLKDNIKNNNALLSTP